MKKFALVFIVAILFANMSCMKDKNCSANPVANEASTIEAYALVKGINALPHASGIYYEIIDQGSGATATINSKITITYRGELLDGQKFDERTTPNDPAWPLGELIEGWIIGIPLVKAGGHIKLIIPSALGYGCTGRGAIPPNAPLYFDINLVSVQ